MSALPVADRPELSARVGSARVTLVTGPAGVGKTVLVQAWAEGTDGVAWVDCGALLVGDRDELVQLLLDAADPTRDETPLPDAEAVAERAAGTGIALVIDDVDRALAGTGRDALSALVRAWPGPGPLVVIGRDLGWLTDAGLGPDVHGIGHDDLLLAPSEVEKVVAASDGLVSADAARRVGGWAGGLQFCRSSTDALQLAPYLDEEVLQWLDPLEREVLDAIAVLGPTSLSELAAVLDLPREDTERVVEHLHRGWVPGLRGPRGPAAGAGGPDEAVWLPGIVGDHLAALVTSASADRVIRLHRRAAVAAEAAGDLSRAHHQILRSGDDSAEADIVRRRAVELVAGGDADTAMGWIDRLPHGDVASDRDLALARAGASLAAGDVPDAAVWMAIAERLSGAGAQGPSVLQPRPLPVANAPRRAAADGVDGVETIDHLFAAWTAYVSDDLDGSEALLRASAADAAPLPMIDAARWALLAQISVERGEWRTAATQIDATIERLDGGGHELDGLDAAVASITARLAARDGNVAVARRESTQAYETLRAGKWWRWRTGRATMLLTLAEAHLDLGESGTAERFLREADASMQGAHRTARLRTRAALVRGVHEAQAARRADLRLSTAELGILPYLASHLTIPAIAAEVHRSPNTIKTQAAAIYRKLGAANRSEAVAAAYEAGLLRDPDRARDANEEPPSQHR